MYLRTIVARDESESQGQWRSVGQTKDNIFLCHTDCTKKLRDAKEEVINLPAGTSRMSRSLHVQKTAVATTTAAAATAAAAAAEAIPEVWAEH